MTNREWLNTLTDEEFTNWLLCGAKIEVIHGTVQVSQPLPKLHTLKLNYKNPYSDLLKWLKRERTEDKEIPPF